MADFGPWAPEVSGGIVPYYSASLAQIVPSASANTKGSFVTANAVDTGRGDALRLLIDRTGDSTSGAIRTLLVDVNVGGVDLIQNLMVCPPVPAVASAQRSSMAEVVFPISVPPGNAVQFRAQGNLASTPGVYLRAERFSSGMPALSMVDTYGADTTNTKGTTVTARTDATSDSVFGSWQQLSASTNRIRALVVAIGHGQADMASLSDCWYEIAIGIGPAGQEQIIAMITGQTNYSSCIPLPAFVGPFCVDVAAGSRLAACIRKTPVSSGVQRSLDVVAYGIR